MKVDQAKRPKQLEQENARLKRLVGELRLEKAVLTDIARGNFQAHSASVQRCKVMWANIRVCLSAERVRFWGRLGVLT